MENVKTAELGSHVVQVTLNRPEKKNAVNLDMFEELPQVAEKIGKDKTARAVVLNGAGGCFCAGLDTAVFQTLAGKIDATKKLMRHPEQGKIANFFQAPVVCWQSIGQPVIAAVEGVCFGAGMQLALAADFRIATPDARFSIMESKWGLIPDMGISQSLPKLIRADQAKELIMTARIFDASEALDMGLITKIAEDPVAAAREMAQMLAARSPDAVQNAKRLVDAMWNADAKTGLAVEAELQAQIIGGTNQVEAVLANMQKRDPNFS